MTIRNLLARFPVSVFFILAYLISWTGIVALVGPGGLSGQAPPDPSLFGLIFIAMLAGPAIAGLGLTIILTGKEGLRELWERQRRWRVNLRWYAIALFTAPLLLAGILGILSLFSPAFTPALFDPAGLLPALLFGVVAGLLAGFIEEIGWTGFALPRLRRHFGLLAASLILGLLWGVWHGPGDCWGNYYLFGNLWIFRILLWIAALTAWRVVIAWVHENTRSLLLAQLTHAGFVGGQAIVVPSTSPHDYLVWYGLFTLALWGIVLIIAVNSLHPDRSFRT